MENLISELYAPLPNEVDLRPSQKRIPLQKCIPIHRTLLPILHILLGLTNNLTSNFISWINERAKTLSTDENYARTLTLIADVAVDVNIRRRN